MKVIILGADLKIRTYPQSDLKKLKCFGDDAPP